MNVDDASTPDRRGSTWWMPIVFILGCELVGVLGAVTTEAGTSTWYLGLNKPAFQPPGWVFGPMWTLLYAMMGVAAWRVWFLGRVGRERRTALWLFGAQLALNAAWSPVFFGAHWVGTALVIIVLLWIALAATIVAFRRVDRRAMWLLLPYLAWITFATILNAAILQLN
jgi:benzodiazapine receptor